jgi:Flp pilus assembly protein TadG
MRRNRDGSAVVEFALMMPWLAFIFVGVIDFGFYAYAAICTESAARVAGIYASGSLGLANSAAASNTVVCPQVLGELKGLPNIPNTLTTCASGPGGITNAQPVAVVTAVLTCATSPKAADCTASPLVSPSSVQLAVTYQSVPMIPIPGVMMNRLTLTRIAEVRISQ